MILTLSVSAGISLSFGRYLMGTSSGLLGFLITFVSPPIETLLSFFEFASSLDDWWEQGRLVNRIRTAKRLTRTVDERDENIWKKMGLSYSKKKIFLLTLYSILSLFSFFICYLCLQFIFFEFRRLWFCELWSVSC